MGKGNRNSQNKNRDMVENADKYLNRQNAKVKKTRKDRAVVIVCAVFALVIAGALIFGALSEAGIIIMAPDAIASSEIVVDAEMMNFFYNDYIMNWYNQYANYIQMLGATNFGPDFSYSLQNQRFGAKQYDSMFLGQFSGTWHDYFLNSVMSEVEMYVVYAQEAKNLGMKLTDEDKKEIDDVIDSLKSNLDTNGASWDAWYGAGVGKNDVRRCYELIYLASDFAEYKQDKLEEALDKDDKELLNYVENNKEEFYFAECLNYTISLSSKGQTDAEYDKAVEKAREEIKKISEAKTPADFVAAIELYENNKDEETSEGTETGSESETTTSTTSETESLSPEEELSSKIESYKDKYEYSTVTSTGTGTDPDNLENWLFKGEGAQEGEHTVIEVTGTETETATTSVDTSDTKKEGSESESATTSTEETTTAGVKTYKTFEATAYHVVTPNGLDKAPTHNFAYLVANEKAVVEQFIKDFKAGDKTTDNFVALAENKNESIHNDPNHKHSDNEVFEYNKLEDQPAGAFNDSYKVLNTWIESDDRKDGDISEILNIKIDENNTTYAVVFFDKQNTEREKLTWYVNAYAATVSNQFETWYEEQLKANPLTYNQKVLSGLDIASVFSWMSVVQ